MNQVFNYYMPTKICYRAGASKQAADLIEASKVLIISDPFLYQTGVAEAIGKSLNADLVTYYSEIEPNPTCESVDNAAAVGREIKADCVIGLGGGSALDVSKMVSCLIDNEGSIYDYYAGGTRTISKRKAKLVCIPTTAGTGSEVTNVGVYTNKKTSIKMPMLSEWFWADLAIVDPELTDTLPASVTASTGMDAFCHAIEAYWNLQSNPLCDMLAMGALKSIMENVKKAYDDPHNKDARGAMMAASLSAGIAFSQTRTTGIHAISFPLTAEFGASHGIACAITLPAFIRLTSANAKEKMTKLANYLGFLNGEELASSVEKLMVSMKMPVRLREIGVKESDLEHITKVGMEPAIMQLTPAKMNQDTVYELLKSIL